MVIKSKSQEKAKQFADKHGFTLRKIKEGRIKITRQDGSIIVVHDFNSAYQQMLSEVYENHSNKNIFE